MQEGDDNCGILCGCCDYLTGEGLARRAAEIRERELVNYRERRARRIAELGLGSHRTDRATSSAVDTRGPRTADSSTAARGSPRAKQK